MFNVISIVLWLLCIFSLAFPWNLKWKHARLYSCLPLLCIVLYLVYEGLMPENMSIRVDLLILYPLLGANVLLMIVRLTRIRRREESSTEEGI